MFNFSGTNDHNTKVTVSMYLDEAYRFVLDDKMLIKNMKEMEEYYIKYVDEAFESFSKTIGKNGASRDAIVLNFASAFSVEKYIIVAKYEAMHNSVNRRLPKLKRKNSYYRETEIKLYYLAGLDPMLEYDPLDDKF